MTTPVTSEKTVCPKCSGSLTTDPRFTKWCPSCHWNALPQGAPSTDGAGKTRGRLAQLDEALEQRLYQQVTTQGAELRPRRGGAHLAVALLALPVHLLTLAALAGAVVLLRINVWTADIAAVLLLGAAWLGRPRLGSLSRLAAKRHRVTREEAPRLWALADGVADELGTRRADVILVDGRFNASYARVGWRRRTVLILGLPLWVSLTEQERVALLAHEFGHGANGDSRRGVWLGAALGSLSEWVQLLRPSRIRTRAGVEALAAMLAYALQTVLNAVAELYLRLLLRVTRLDSRRAEYLADSFTVRLAGTAGAAGLMEALRLETAYETMIAQRSMAAQRIPAQRRRAARGTAVQGADQEEKRPTEEQPDLWTSLAAYVRSIPPEERTRRVIAAQLGRESFDTTHPPTHLRLAFVRGLPAGEPAVTLDEPSSVAIDRELAPVGRRIEAAVTDR
ncbi:M48 family metallopeptidase [Streptacidiphilus anmyonensis]|uniref:M48 family metallopeptidase n=1 Tax=Streptacidiphilus anmyonensis TaxID=405782 RepID=UPI000693362D|nr:M48 family metallopeptidase [Streptacidiphilus anmyonensis]